MVLITKVVLLILLVVIIIEKIIQWGPMLDTYIQIIINLREL